MPGATGNAGSGPVESLVDEGQLQSIGLLGVEASESLLHVWQLFSVLPERDEQGLRHADDAHGSGQLLRHLLDGGPQGPQAVLVLDLEDLGGQLGRHERVPIAVATHPGAEPERLLDGLTREAHRTDL